MPLDLYKKIIQDNVTNNADRIREFGRDIYQHAEMGFEEFRTAEQVKRVFSQLNLAVETQLAITGVKGVLSGKYSGPTVAILGEMDGLLCKEHPQSNKSNQTAHICGHNAQLAAMVGAAYALADQKIIDQLRGKVVFMATPAEEYVELEKRRQLREQGKLVYLAGKPELIRIGAFDQIDLALITHVGADIPGKRIGLGGTANGFIAKSVHFKGRAAHAGAAPEQGRNALQAATIALNAINAWRESFRDDQHIKVHPIMTGGGEQVNIVPGEARLELYIRAKSLEAILETSEKVNRALQAGALAMGCTVVIQDLPGFMPQTSSQPLVDVIRDNARLLLSEEQIVANGHFPGSADMGDLTQIMPGTIIEVGGTKGAPHTAGFDLIDEEAAYIVPAQLLAMTVLDLLVAGKAEQIIQADNPPLTKEGYCRLIDGFFQEQTFDYQF